MVGGLVLIFDFLSREDTAAWLTDPRWIVFNGVGDFSEYLEDNYFAPGTAKNSEFEVILASFLVDGKVVFSCFFRIKDTPENRESLKAALAEFHKRRLFTSAELSAYLGVIRSAIRRDVVPRLR